MDKPVPPVTEETRAFWEAAREGRLVAPYCRACGLFFFYPRTHCPRCWGREHEWRPCSGRGRIYAFTVVHRAPMPAFEGDVPYVVALVELDEGIRLMGNVRGADPARLETGQAVQVVFEPRGGEWRLPQFRLRDDRGDPARPAGRRPARERPPGAS